MLFLLLPLLFFTGSVWSMSKEECIQKIFVLFDINATLDHELRMLVNSTVNNFDKINSNNALEKNEKKITNFCQFFNKLSKGVQQTKFRELQNLFNAANLFSGVYNFGFVEFCAWICKKRELSRFERSLADQIVTIFCSPAICSEWSLNYVRNLVHRVSISCANKIILNAYPKEQLYTESSSSVALELKKCFSKEKISLSEFNKVIKLLEQTGYTWSKEELANTRWELIKNYPNFYTNVELQLEAIKKNFNSLARDNILTWAMFNFEKESRPYVISEIKRRLDPQNKVWSPQEMDSLIEEYFNNS